MLTNEFDKEDGIQLAIGGGKWYVFFAKGKDFFKKHRMKGLCTYADNEEILRMTHCACRRTGPRLG